MKTLNIKLTKTIITSFFLISLYWMAYLIFTQAHYKMLKLNFPDKLEVIFLASIEFFITTLLMGLLSWFIHFVFVKLLYADDIKQFAILMIKDKRRKLNKITNDIKSKK